MLVVKVKHPRPAHSRSCFTHSFARSRRDIHASLVLQRYYRRRRCRGTGDADGPRWHWLMPSRAQGRLALCAEDWRASRWANHPALHETAAEWFVDSYKCVSGLVWWTSDAEQNTFLDPRFSLLRNNIPIKQSPCITKPLTIGFCASCSINLIRKRELH